MWWCLDIGGEAGVGGLWWGIELLTNEGGGGVSGNNGDGGEHFLEVPVYNFNMHYFTRRLQ